MRPERWRFTAPLRLKSIFRRGRAERELDEELQFHLDQKTAEGIAEGLSPEEARLRALRAMGGLDQRKEEMRDARRVHWLTDFADDARYAIRSLRRTPALTLFVVVTIALGIGMTALPFSMLDALVFRPYPVPRPGEVVTIVGTSRESAYESFSYREYLDIRAQTKSYDGVVASTLPQPVGFSAKPGDTPLVHGGVLVSGSYFRVLEVEPTLGRSFRDDEDQAPGRDAVAVLSWEFWHRELGGDRSIVGRSVRLNGRDFTVIGVAPESFPGMMVFYRPEIYVPLAMAETFPADPQKKLLVDRDERVLTVRARLKRGVTLADARNEMTALARNFARDYPAVSRDRGAAVRTQIEMRTRDDDGNWKFGVIFTVLALTTLLVACTNAAGLLLSRARMRTREIAVRIAIGAGRFRLIRLLLAESLVLALLGGLAGIAVGYLGIRVLDTFTIPAELPVKVPFRMDLRVLAASLALSVVSAILCGLAPALQATRTDVASGLKTADGEEPRRGRRRLWGRNALVVAQVAMSLMLLAGAFLMYRGFQESVTSGVEFAKEAKDHVLMARFDPRLVQYDAARTRRFYELLAERLRAVPEIRSTAYTQNPPLEVEAFEQVAFVPEGFQMPRDRETFRSTMDTVDDGFFQTMGVPILRGRGFRPSDDEKAPRVAVVNELFAKRYFPKTDALGKRFRLGGIGGPPVEIVGIARTIKYLSTVDKGIDFVYLPVTQRPVAKRVLLVRSVGDPLSMVLPVKDAVRALDPNMPMLEMRSYDELYRYAAVEGPGVAVKLVTTLGLIALFLAGAGLYGVVAYNVARRTREIGIRIAIGAKPVDVLKLVMGKGLTLVGIGSALGLAMGFGLERVMNAMLFRASGTDVLVYALIVPAMVFVTMLAAYVPARRATHIAPTLALRCE